MIDDKLFDEISQNSHWAGGLAWTWGSIVLFGPSYLWWFISAGVLIAGIKEFVYDYIYEDTEVRGSSLEDFLYYCVGIFGAAGAYWVKVLVTK